MKSRQFLCIELLNTFSKKELDGLNDIISCKYFNKDRYIGKLLVALKKYALGKETFELDLQVKVYGEVFTDLPVPDGDLEKKQRSLLNAKMSILIRLAEQFLAIENINNDDLQKYELLYGTLLKRGQIRLFDKRIEANKRSLEEENKIDESHQYKKYIIEKKKLDYLLQTGQLLSEDNISEIVHQLDVYYLLNKLSLYNTALSLKRVYSGREYDFEVLDAGLVSLLKLPQYARHPMIEIFNVCIKILKTYENKDYLMLLTLLDKHTEVVPIKLLKSFYAIANIHCATQIRFGHLEYNKEMFNLCKIMHDKNLFIEDNFIQVGQIKNMIVMACREDEYDWAREILEHYKGFISREVRKSVYNFNLGAIAFYEKDYEAAHDKFIQVDKINTTYDINVRVLILKCLYEKEKEYSDYTVQAFRSAERFFSKHQSIIPKSKKGYTNFIKILIPLYRLRHNINSTQTDIERIKEKLEQQTVNSDKRWLLEKIQELT